MKQAIKFLGLFLMLTISKIAYGQKQERIYYDKNWKVTTESKAVYFRTASFDEKGKPVGITKDYYITGELQWEGKMLYIDKYDNSKDTSDGKCTWYHKGGMKSRESSMIANKEDGLTLYWHQNGQKAKEIEYKLGVLNGKWIEYYESGKIKFRIDYKDGKPVERWVTECDEFDKCQKIFSEWFMAKENENKWVQADLDDYKSEIIEGEGLLMKTKTDKGYAQLIHLPIDIANNFSIETIIYFKSGEKNSAHGIVYGFKDWSNYYYFYISANGYYRIGAVIEGLQLEYSKWTQSNTINQNLERNLLKVSKVKDKVYFSINGQILASEDFYAFKGNRIGFYIPSGKKEVLFDRLIVRQDIKENNVISQFSNGSIWRGNGTGFFIDAKGYIATNYHVIKDASEIEIDLIQNGQKKSYKAKVISIDKQNDLAVIKIDDQNFKPYVKLPYNFKTQISDIGSNVFALGYPMALSVMGNELKFTDGKISSKTGYQGDITTYQISVPVQPGNSGGPLYDYEGNIIGVISSKIMEADNVSYAIKSSYLKNLLDVLPENINIPNDQALSGLSLIEKIKLVSDYVVLIKIR